LKPRQISIDLLKQAQEIEQTFVQLGAAGFQAVFLEQLQMNVLLLLAKVNGINRNDPALDWLLQPAFDFLQGKNGIDRCMRALYERLTDLRRERRAKVEMMGQEIGERA
jgi:hypothetical protein